MKEWEDFSVMIIEATCDITYNISLMLTKLKTLSLYSMLIDLLYNQLAVVGGYLLSRSAFEELSPIAHLLDHIFLHALQRSSFLLPAIVISNQHAIVIP